MSSIEPEPYVPRPQFVFDETSDVPKLQGRASVLMLVIEFLCSVIAGILIAGILSLPLFFVALFFVFVGMTAYIFYVTVPLFLFCVGLLIFKQIPSYRKYRQELDHPGYPDIMSIIYGAFFVAPIFAVFLSTIYARIMVSGVDMMPM